ncbi:peptide-N4-(N-acetyl-beta-glucosaminyl) asparagine amidase [Fistulifera solaris]|uniref:Peptide-N4-(N-acetyl-beta-glucosaminyl) asparagine amidase n=1 Tax=Fistulifera solaris TaxID=1519565 RepID=A0A1Z5JAK5_FISSO|nr:peptide-N4-(N-acetyl-beta-glucosaminyl) asparagine amidase [Fistulifera solaris]|eukprot:GAX11020.1 peptide-N4-(N-acetyl-beta-glucosaminyl) asparagine amidase [Fistulifera solaris]
MNATTFINEDFKRRIEGALKTVQAWEDPQLLADCRATIPWEDLKKDDGPFSEKNDALKHPSYSIIFFQRLCRYFKSRMTWINQPMCLQCQTTDHVQFIRTRGPETQPEIQGKASRVEVYQCTVCDSENDITFPRYNCPRTLLQTRQGRCGEYANLFGLYCRAVGYHTRYILDMTDHVWIEASFPNHHRDQSNHYYCMGDGCEGVVNEPSMYEAGWGKQLSYILAITPSYVMDVTPRYTRQFDSHDFLTRRRAITSSEEAGQDVIHEINVTLLGKLSSVKQKQSIQKQWKEEEELLSSYKRLTEWAKESSSYHHGRISGATQWKVARGEAGASSYAHENSEKKDENNQQLQCSTEYSIQTFLPSLLLKQAFIAVHPRPPLAQCTRAIIVSGAACAMGIPNQLSAVVVDPQTGTILQSKSFVSLQHLDSFVDKLHETLILVVHGQLLNENNEYRTNPMNMHSRLPLWKNEHVWEGGILYVGVMGQTLANASQWTVCAKISDTVDPIVLQWNSTATVPDLKLRVHRSTRPNAVTGRLPDSYLPLAKQVTATFSQKQAAFESFVSSLSSMSPISGQRTSIVGFCTKPGAPIYLIGACSYPLLPTSDEWATFVLLPAWLVPANDCSNGAAALDPDPLSASLSYEVPLDTNVFVERLGPQLLVNTNQLIPTDAALQRKNPRLIAFYFSAHWCGPCRSLTPMLIEFYNVLNEAFPSHGLEIVFVSSDRDATSFQHYYATMPWAAIPFEPALHHFKSKLSLQFGVQGIPSLFILDAISGAVVVDARHSRGDIHQSCRRGDDAIVEQFQEWLHRLPSESREILDLLQASCHDTQVAPTDKDGCHDSAMLNKYLFQDDDMVSLEKCLNRCGEPFTVEAWESQWRASAKVDWRIVVKTALQYVANARREPWNPKFRSFHWSNAVADRINGVMHGLEWWCQQGLEVYTSRDDYVAWIPVYVDLDVLHARWSALLDDGTQ